METQIDDQGLGDVLFENNARKFLNSCSSEAALPELQFKDGDQSFPDNVVSLSNAQTGLHLALLSETLPVSLPEIESSFNFVSSSSSHGTQEEISSRFHPYSRTSTDDKRADDAISYCGVSKQPSFEPALVANQSSYELYHTTTNGSNQRQMHSDQGNMIFERSISQNQMVATSQPPNYQWLTTQNHQYVMNSNNNNVNSTASYHVQQPASNYYIQDLQNRHGNLQRENLQQFTSSSSSTPFFNVPSSEQSDAVYDVSSRQIVSRDVTSTSIANPIAQDIARSKFSPDGKKKGGTKKRKKRGANEPQKPVSAYALFFRDTQASIKSDNPSATFGEISKVVASMWDGLSEETKQVYKQKTETAKRDYLKQLAAYRANLVSKGGFDVDEDDKHPRLSPFKLSDQRSSISMSSFYNSSSPKRHLLANHSVTDGSRHPSSYNVIDLTSAQKRINFNVLCDAAQPSMKSSQHPEVTTTIFAQSASGVQITP